MLVASLIAAAISNNNGTRSGLEALICVIYTVALLGSRGRTVGNLAVGTAVVPVEGGQLSYGKAFIRWLIQTILEVTVIGGISTSCGRYGTRASRLCTTRSCRRWW